MMKKQNWNPHCNHIQLLVLASFLTLVSFASTLAQFKVPKLEPEESVLDFKAWEILYQPAFSYNRVQGLFAGIDAAVYLKQLWHLKLQGNLGYGVEDKQRYRVGGQRSFFNSSPLTIGVYYYDQVSSLDDWYIGNIENSLAALVFKADFKDFYVQKGLQVFIDQNLSDQHTIRIEVNQLKYEVLSRRTNWALFYKNKQFRSNPPVIPEKTISARLLWVFDWLDTDLSPCAGWYLEGIAEYTHGDQVTTQGLFMTIKRLLPTFGSQQLQMKIMVGARKGCDQRDEQYLMDMGGIGSLVAYNDKEFKNGNRFLYGTAHYLFNQGFMGRRPIRYLPFSNQFVFGIFAESGWLCFGEKNSNPVDDFSRLKIQDFKTDVGLSLHLSDELARIDVAKRTDRAKDAWRITVRLMTKF
jgi:hypothetical protein